MSNVVTRRLTFFMGVLVVMLAALPREASSQVLALGGQATMNQDIAVNATWGFGVRGQVGLPMTGINLQATVDFYNPDCGPVDCDFRDVGINLLWSIPAPYVANPYFGAGLAMQHAGGGWDLGDSDDYGLNLLAGIVLQGPTFQRFQPFGEVKYEVMQDFESQLVFSGGILLRLF